MYGLHWGNRRCVLERGMDPSEWPRLHILGSNDRFNVRRVWCIGRNYAEHAKEMGDTGTKPPLMFAKNPMGLVPVAQGETGHIVYPGQTKELHYEVEWVLAIGAGGRCVGSTVGLDMTRRDLQRAMKGRRGPWAIAKDFADSAPIGPLRLGGLPKEAAITLQLDGEIRQSSNISHMMWGPDALIERLNALCPLAPGDLIFTGTPAGVGPVEVGQKMVANIEGVCSLTVSVLSPPQ